MAKEARNTEAEAMQRQRQGQTQQIKLCAAGRHGREKQRGKRERQRRISREMPYVFLLAVSFALSVRCSRVVVRGVVGVIVAGAC
jgi:hypothetical protein